MSPCFVRKHVWDKINSQINQRFYKCTHFLNSKLTNMPDADILNLRANEKKRKKKKKVSLEFTKQFINVVSLSRKCVTEK